MRAGRGGCVKAVGRCCPSFSDAKEQLSLPSSRAGPLGRDSGLWPRSGGRGLSYAEAPVSAPQKRPLLLSLRFGGGGARACSLSGCLSIRTPGAGCDFLLRCNKLPGSSGCKHLSSQGCRGQKASISLVGPASGGAGLVPSGGCRGDSISLPSPASGGARGPPPTSVWLLLARGPSLCLRAHISAL